MSTSIDNKVVEMRFDNQHFEKNVQTSMSTLEKLKQSLKLDGAAKGLESISYAAKRFDMSPMGRAVETVQARFSALQVMAITALSNITNSAVNAGKRLVSAFTIDPVKSGLQEYETQLNAVQTILANTEHKGATLEKVNAALDELNTYADKTIYNFTEMTRNIGTFTAAGVGLDDSVSAIKGIANLAAVSGSTSQQASTAMYQLSQALATGTVKLMDWNSVVNAGMGGQVFQDALTRTAAVMAGSAKDVEKWREKNIEAHGSFRDSLTEGAWLTADVLTETLSQLSGAYTKADLLNKGYTEEQANDILKLSKTAEDAATKVKTFSQLMDTLKESAQSGWAQTWEILVGDFEEAKSLWTGVSDVLGGFISKAADNRNKLLEGAMSSNWDKLINKVETAGVKASDFEDAVKDAAKAHDIDIDALVKKYGSIGEVFKAGAVSSDILKDALKGLGSASTKTVKEAETHTVKAGDTLTRIAQKYGTTVDAIVKANGITNKNLIKPGQILKISDAVTETSEAVDLMDDSILGLVNGVDELGGREMLIESFKNIWEGILGVIKPIKNAFKSVFPPTTSEQLYKMIEGFHNLTSKFKLTVWQSAKLFQTFRGLFSALDIGWTVIKSFGKGLFDLAGKYLPGALDGILTISSSLGVWLTGLRDSVKETDIFGKVVDGIVGGITKFTSAIKENLNVSEFIQTAIAKVKDLINIFKAKFSMSGFEESGSIMQTIWNCITNIGSAVGELARNIGKALTNIFSFDNLSSGLDIFNGGIIAAILLNLKKFTGGLDDSFGGIGDLLEGAVGVLDGVKGSLEAWQQSLKAGTLMKIAGAVAILAAAIVVLAAIDQERLNTAIGAITMLFVDLMGAMAVFNSMGGAYKGAIKATGLMIGMSAAILIMAVALEKLSSLSFEELAVGLLGVVGLTATIVAAAKVMSANTGKVIKGAGGLILFAAAVGILAKVCKDMASMSWDEMKKGLVGIGAIMAEVALFSVATSKVGNMGSSGLGLIAIAAAMKIFASAVMDFANISWDEMKRGLVGMAGALLSVAVAVKIMSGSKVMSVGVGLAIVSGALLVLADALVKMSAFTWEELIRALGAMAGSLFILAAALNLMTGTLGGSAALLVAAASLAILAPVLEKLGSLSWQSIGKGLVALAGAFAVIGIAGLVLGPLVPTLLAFGGALALVGASVLLFGLGVAAVAAGITALVGVTAGGATAIVAALSIIITGIVNLIPAIAKALGDAIIVFCEVIAQGAPAIGEAVKAIVLSLVDVLVECVPQITDGILKLLSSVLTSLATYTPQIVDSLFDFVIALLDGLATRMPELIQSVVDVFMAFFSGVIDALSGIDTSTLVKGVAGVGIMAGVMVALGAVASLAPAAMVGVLGMGAVIAELALVIAAIGALAQIPGLDWLIGEGGALLQNIGNAIGGFVGGIVGGIAEGITASLPQIATDLSNFMTNLQPFIDGAKTIDESMMAGVASIVDIITQLTATSILDSLTSWITGGASFADFGTQLVAFGGSLKEFASSVSGVDTSVVTAAADAASALFTAASQIPNSGGIISWFTGDNELSTFATQLKSFGTGLKDFAAEVIGIDTASVTAAASAASALITAASTIPNTGGIISWFTGDNDLSTFSAQLKSFGTGIKDFANEVTDIDTTAVSTAATAASTLITAASSIPNSGGIISWFTGDNDLSTFSTQLKSFGKGIQSFSDEVSGINIDAVRTGVSAVNSVTALATTMPEGGYTGLSTFGNQLTTFAGKLGTFSKNISGISVSSLSESVSGINTLMITLKNINDTAGDIGSNFGISLDNIGKEGINSLIKAFTDATTKVRQTAIDLLETFIKGAKSVASDLKSAIKTLAGDAADAAEDKYDSFYEAGKYVATGFADGISANSFKAEAKAKAMAKAALKAAEEALGIKSPSKEFYAAGNFSGMGFINALEDYVPISYRAGAAMAGAARNGLSKAVSKVSDLIFNGIDTQPTIRPVMDLSGVAYGVGAANEMIGGINPSVRARANIGMVSSMMNSNQNGFTNGDVVDAIDKLGRKLGNISGNNYSIGGITYDKGSDVADAIETLVRATLMERRR